MQAEIPVSKGFIDREGLAQLKAYKYKAGQYTWLDYKMTPFWEWSVTLLPLWMAPNLVTFIGWLFVILSYANMLIWDYTFQKDIPSYCFFLAAACIFIYSTLDAIDGKQARRTKTSSPLGQLFDHGCDSFSVSFFILAICQATKLETMEVFLIFTASQTSFWTSNWMEYNTGVLQTSVGNFGVTEAEFLCAGIHLITGIFGQEFWQITMSVFIPANLEADFGPIMDVRIGAVAAYFFSIVLFIMVAYSVIQTSLRSEKNKLKPLGEYFTLVVVLLMEYIWFNLEVYQEYNGIILVNFGIVQSLIICKMIICSVTKVNIFPKCLDEIRILPC